MSSFTEYTTVGAVSRNPLPISSPRPPTTSDILAPGGEPYNVGRLWVNTATLAVYSYAGSGNWSLMGSGTSAAINSITGDSGGAELPSGGNFNILGTANQILVAGSANTETLSLIGPYTPATYTAHGVLLGEGTSSIVATAAGTSGQVFTSGGASANGAYQNVGVNSGLTAHGVLLAENNSAFAATAAGSNGQVFLGSTGADPAFGTLTTSTGVGYTLGAHALAINILSGGYNVNAASTGVALVAQNSYTVTQAAQTSFSLPATAAVGDTFLIASGTGNTSGWIITQGANQEIWANSNHTTNGATGTLAGAIHCSVILMCVVANVDFIVVGGSGITGLTFT